MKSVSRLVLLFALAHPILAGTEKPNQTIETDVCGAYFSLLHGWHTRPPLTDEENASLVQLKLSKRQQKDFGTYYFDSLLSFEECSDAKIQQ
jgi:hypothetical protein